MNALKRRLEKMGKPPSTKGKGASKHETTTSSSKSSNDDCSLTSTMIEENPKANMDTAILGTFLSNLKTSLESLLQNASRVQELSSNLDAIESQYNLCQTILSTSLQEKKLLQDKDAEIEKWKQVAAGCKELLIEDNKKWMRERDDICKERDNVRKELNDLEEAHRGLKQHHDAETMLLKAKYKELEEARNLIINDSESSKSAIEKLVKDIEKRDITIDSLTGELAKETCAKNEYKAKAEALALAKQAFMNENRELKRRYLEERGKIESLFCKTPDTVFTEQFTGLATDLIKFVIKHLDSSGLQPREPEQNPIHKPLCRVIPFSNSYTSKCLRAAWIVSKLSRSFVSYFFRPFVLYLNSQDQDDNLRLIRWSQQLSDSNSSRSPFEAIWRNLTLCAMAESGEFGEALMKCPSRNMKDGAREELIKDDLDQLWPVLNAKQSQRENIETDLHALVTQAVRLWVLSRRNIEPVEVVKEVTWATASDWDVISSDYVPSGDDVASNKHGDEDGVLIDGNALETASTISSIYDDELKLSNARNMKLCLFPAIFRQAQTGRGNGGPIVTLHEGIALFEGSSLLAQGEKEVNDIRMRELQERRHRLHSSRRHSHGQPPSAYDTKKGSRGASRSVSTVVAADGAPILQQIQQNTHIEPAPPARTLTSEARPTPPLLEMPRSPTPKEQTESMSVQSTPLTTSTATTADSGIDMAPQAVSEESGVSEVGEK